MAKTTGNHHHREELTATVAFAALEMAIRAGDLSEAARAQEALDRLGFEVRFRGRAAPGRRPSKRGTSNV